MPGSRGGLPPPRAPRSRGEGVRAGVLERFADRVAGGEREGNDLTAQAARDAMLFLEEALRGMGVVPPERRREPASVDGTL